MDATGPHGLTLNSPAQVGAKEAEQVLDSLQAIKKLELKPVPFFEEVGRSTG
jgi:hypothetical protein